MGFRNIFYNVGVKTLEGVIVDKELFVYTSDLQEGGKVEEPYLVYEITDGLGTEFGWVSPVPSESYPNKGDRVKFGMKRFGGILVLPKKYDLVRPIVDIQRV